MGKKPIHFRPPQPIAWHRGNEKPLRTDLCLVIDCHRAVHRTGLCRPHYEGGPIEEIAFPDWAPRFVAGAPGQRGRKADGSFIDDIAVTRNADGVRVCNVEGCVRKHRAKGLCDSHNGARLRAERMASGLVGVTNEPRKNRSRAGRICIVENCERSVHAKDWCHSHYKTHAPRKRTCTVPGCDKKFHAQGFCADHYDRAMRAGKIGVVRPINRPTMDRFEDYRSEPNAAGCRIWSGPIDARSGRGTFTHEDQTVTLAHRYAYKLAHGEFPVDASGRAIPLDHHCRVPLCTEPSHLEPVTHKVNVHRGLVAHGKRPITEADAGWFWIALNAWRHGAENFPAAVVTVADGTAA